jgi:SAM-dependent methyltransferase
MKAHFTMTLTDLSEDMLATSRELNPECEHILGDMRTLRLDRDFDAVFAHDAVSYLTTREDVRATVKTAAVHLRPGGVALFVPDHVRETFRPSTDHGGTDSQDRAFRYLEWTWDPEPDDDTYVAEYAFLIREGDEVRVEHDRHVCGAFPRNVWLAAPSPPPGHRGDAGRRGRGLPRRQAEGLSLRPRST